MTDETENYVWYKHEYGTYRVEKSRAGLYNSILDDGTRLVCAATEEACRVATEYIHLPYEYGPADMSDVKVSKDYADTHVDL